MGTTEHPIPKDLIRSAQSKDDPFGGGANSEHRNYAYFNIHDFLLNVPHEPQL
jgi:hypothetical protein